MTTILSPRRFLALCLLLLLSGCLSRDFTGVPNMPVTDDPGVFVARRAHVRGLPEGDDSYSTAFRAGCQTSMGIVGAGTLRLLPEKIDPDKLSHDKLYFRGYLDGQNYCKDRLEYLGM